MTDEQPTMSDQMLLAALQQGDQAAWAFFLARYDPLINGVIGWHKWRFDSQIREDLAQTVRMEVAKAIGTVADPSRLGAFVKSACMHRCVDEVRRQIRMRRAIAPVAAIGCGAERAEDRLEAGEAFDPVREVMRQEDISALRSALGELNETCATAVREFYCEGLSYKEMAQRSGIAVNTVGSRLAKCLERLREILGGKISADRSTIV